MSFFYYISGLYGHYQREGAFTAAKTIRRKFRVAYLRRHPLYIALIGINVRLRRIGNWGNFTDADPFKRIWVDPSEITLRVPGSNCHTWGKVVEDRWETVPIAKNDHYQALHQHFVEDEDHPVVNRSKRRLFSQLRDQGYIPQREFRSLIHWIPGCYRDFEVATYIDSDGAIHWAGWGRNRLFMAKILDLDRVAVQIRVRHREWQAIRDEIREADSARDLSSDAKRHLGHPDMQDLL